jgi:hypothetical protein
MHVDERERGENKLTRHLFDASMEGVNRRTWHVLLFDLAGQSEESMARSDGIKLWTHTYISCSMPSVKIDSIGRGCPNVALSSSFFVSLFYK